MCFNYGCESETDTHLHLSPGGEHRVAAVACDVHRGRVGQALRHVQRGVDQEEGVVGERLPDALRVVGVVGVVRLGHWGIPPRDGVQGGGGGEHPVGDGDGGVVDAAGRGRAGVHVAGGVGRVGRDPDAERVGDLADGVGDGAGRGERACVAGPAHTQKTS